MEVKTAATVGNQGLIGWWQNRKMPALINRPHHILLSMDSNVSIGMGLSLISSGHETKITPTPMSKIPTNLQNFLFSKQGYSQPCTLCHFYDGFFSHRKQQNKKTACNLSLVSELSASSRSSSFMSRTAYDNALQINCDCFKTTVFRNQQRTRFCTRICRLHSYG